jgi:hypothetical protein
MPGYMDGYGAGEDVRASRLKRIFGIGIPAILLAVAAFFYFRTWGEERAMRSFLAAVEAKQYDDAYRMWCNPAKPCRYYPMERFLEDWGPNGAYKNIPALDFDNIDYCNTGVVFETKYPDAEPFGLWVERSNKVISFAPWQRCPGKHLQFGLLWQKIFG